MESHEKRRLKKRGILLASGGLLLTLLVALGLKYLGIAHFTFRSWLFSLVLTLTLQSILWLVPHLGWDRYIPWDRHYIDLPMLAVAFLYCRFIASAPEVRIMVLMLWFVSLLFMAGLAGFLEVSLLSSAMTAGYIAVLGLLAARGTPMSLPFEATIAAVFLMICIYAGVVFERLRRDRHEMEALRRRLAELALTDSLTRLPNRRQFEDALRAELARIRRHGGHCCVVMMDVDHFKNYNDRMGHPAGDALLQQLAGVIRSHLRAEDMAARYGGEEFAIVMRNSGLAEGIDVLERLRAVVENHPFPRRQTQPEGRLTVSAGIAGCPEDGADYETLVSKADAALYAAKSGGRNRVEAAVRPQRPSSSPSSR